MGHCRRSCTSQQAGAQTRLAYSMTERCLLLSAVASPGDGGGCADLLCMCNLTSDRTCNLKKSIQTQTDRTHVVPMRCTGQLLWHCALHTDGAALHAGLCGQHQARPAPHCQCQRHSRACWPALRRSDFHALVTFAMLALMPQTCRGQPRLHTLATAVRSCYRPS